MSSYHKQNSDGSMIYRCSEPKATTPALHMPDVSAFLSETRQFVEDEGPIVFGRPHNDSSHVGRFAYRPAKRRLYVLFKGGEEFVYEGVSRRLFEGLMNAKSAGEYFYRYVGSTPEQHAFRRLK